MKVILDTDIGSDIDDAVCLAYLLSEPQCELIGITTVSGEAVERAKIASVLCKEAGKDVPIYPGAVKPLLIPEQKQPKAQQAAALGKWEHQKTFPDNAAVEFLRQTIRANPGEVTLLGIGPMTNIGLLFATDPEIPALLKSLVMMVGVFTNKIGGVGPLEWNALCDPHALAIIYANRVAQHRSVGLDVTMQVKMPAAEVRQRFNKGLLRPVLDFAEVWFSQVAHEIVFHDPLAAVTIFDDAVCGFERGNVEVELCSPRTLGLTHLTKDANGRHEAALTVDAPRFFDRYFGTVTP